MQKTLILLCPRLKSPQQSPTVKNDRSKTDPPLPLHGLRWPALSSVFLHKSSLFLPFSTILTEIVNCLLHKNSQLVKFPANVLWHIFGKISNMFLNLLISIAIGNMYKATLHQICRQILQVVFFLWKIFKISGQNNRQN